MYSSYLGGVVNGNMFKWGNDIQPINVAFRIMVLLNLSVHGVTVNVTLFLGIVFLSSK